jgi:hypothetical protein
MLSIRKLSTVLFSGQTKRIAMSFSGNNWKDRDEAAEKVFISQSESAFALI